MLASLIGGGTVVVAGACGFIGFYLVEKLHSAGVNVVALDRVFTDEAKYLQRTGVQFIVADIAEEGDYRKLPRDNVAAFINLACVQPANLAADQAEAGDFIRVNTLGVARALEYCKSVGAGKFVHTVSHRATQALWERGAVITEEAVRALKYTGKFSLFSISEAAAVDIIEHYVQQHLLSAAILRLPSVYGYGHHESFFMEGRVVKTGFGLFIEKAIRGETIEIWGQKDRGRDVVYVKDVVDAIVRVISRPNARGLYNIASGRMLTLQEQVDATIEVFGSEHRRSEIVYRPDRPNNIDACCYDISKARRELEWEPKYSFRDMLLDYKIEMESGRTSFLLSRKHRLASET